MGSSNACALAAGIGDVPNPERPIVDMMLIVIAIKRLFRSISFSPSIDNAWRSLRPLH
jgi:hypothetical protein